MNLLHHILLLGHLQVIATVCDQAPGVLRGSFLPLAKHKAGLHGVLKIIHLTVFGA